jgi:tRNA(Glu) U13 pseudouridine synthase TruD
MVVAEHNPAGKFAALVVSFTLAPGCYATMALRELMNSPSVGSSARNHQQPDSVAEKKQKAEAEPQGSSS